jgi:hypothetical protein
MRLGIEIMIIINHKQSGLGIGWTTLFSHNDIVLQVILFIF